MGENWDQQIQKQEIVDDKNNITPKESTIEDALKKKLPEIGRISSAFFYLWFIWQKNKKTYNYYVYFFY